MQVFIDRNAFVPDAQGLSILRGLTAEESDFYLQYICGRSGDDWCTAQSIGRYHVLSQRHERAMRQSREDARLRPTVPAVTSVPIPHAVTTLAEFHGGNLILAWRIHLRLTQKDVAAKMGLQQSAFSKIERGESRRLRHSTLERIAGALSLSIEQLGGYPAKSALPRRSPAKADAREFHL